MKFDNIIVSTYINGGVIVRFILFDKLLNHFVNLNIINDDNVLVYVDRLHKFLRRCCNFRKSYIYIF